MTKHQVLLEIKQARSHAFEAYRAELASPLDAVAVSGSLLEAVAGLGVEMVSDLPAVPMVGGPTERLALMGFESSSLSDDVVADSLVIAAEVDGTRLPELSSRKGLTVWENTALTLYGDPSGIGDDWPGRSVGAPGRAFDAARSVASVDCRPFRDAVTIAQVRTLLGVDRVWSDGFRGQNIVVGIIDEGVNGDEYPVVGGFSRPNAQLPGAAPITSHGSMCAADVLVAAPAAKLYDYPFLGIQNSGGALQMFQAALEQRRIDGTPHLLNNSYGFTGVPTREQAPNHEIWNIDHPLHRKIREVVTSRAMVLFAAGNCGHECPSGNCHSSGVGAGRSIHGSNSLPEVLTIAAVNAAHQRIGYSSEGPGMFEPAKPDFAARTATSLETLGPVAQPATGSNPLTAGPPRRHRWLRASPPS